MVSLYFGGDSGCPPAESRGYSAEKIRDIMASQADEETFAGQADERLDNSGSPEQTRKQIDRLLAERGIP